METMIVILFSAARRNFWLQLYRARRPRPRGLLAAARRVGYSFQPLD
jgi:hypothetical protein